MAANKDNIMNTFQGDDVPKTKHAANAAVLVKPTGQTQNGQSSFDESESQHDLPHAVAAAFVGIIDFLPRYADPYVDQIGSRIRNPTQDEIAEARKSLETKPNVISSQQTPPQSSSYAHESDAGSHRKRRKCRI